LEEIAVTCEDRAFPFSDSLNDLADTRWRRLNNRWAPLSPEVCDAVKKKSSRCPRGQRVQLVSAILKSLAEKIERSNMGGDDYRTFAASERVVQYRPVARHKLGVNGDLS